MIFSFDKTRSYERNLTVVGKSRFPWKRACTTWPPCSRSFSGICQNLWYLRKSNLLSWQFNVSVYCKSLFWHKKIKFFLHQYVAFWVNKKMRSEVFWVSGKSASLQVSNFFLTLNLSFAFRVEKHAGSDHSFAAHHPTLAINQQGYTLCLVAIFGPGCGKCRGSQRWRG